MQFTANKMSELVSWCFKPSQPQRITSGLKKKKFNPAPSYSAHKTIITKLLIKLLPTQIFKKKHACTNNRHQIVKEMVLPISPLLFFC